MGRVLLLVVFSFSSFVFGFEHEADIRLHAKGTPIVVYSEPEFEPHLRERAMRVVDYHLSKYRNLPANTREKILIVYDELVRNVFQHAHKNDLDKRIYVRIYDVNGSLHLQVMDEGGSFYHPDKDVTRLRKASETEKDVLDLVANHRNHEGGGRGQLYIENFTQGMKYEPHKRGERIIGTSVTVWFTLQEAKTNPEGERVLREKTMKAVDSHLAKYSKLPQRIREKILAVYNELIGSAMASADPEYFSPENIEQKVHVQVHDLEGELALEISVEGGNFYNPTSKTRDELSQQLIRKYAKSVHYEPYMKNGNVGTTAIVHFGLRNRWQRFLHAISNATCSQAIITVPPHSY